MKNHLEERFFTPTVACLQFTPPYNPTKPAFLRTFLRENGDFTKSPWKIVFFLNFPKKIA